MVRMPADKREYRLMCVAMRKRLIKHNRRSEPGGREWRQTLRLIAELDQVIAFLDS